MKTKKILTGLCVLMMLTITCATITIGVTTSKNSVTGIVMSTRDNKDGTVAVALDTSGNGVIDFTRTFVASDQIITTILNQKGKGIRINYHTDYGDGPWAEFIIDTIKLLNGPIACINADGITGTDTVCL